LQLEAAFNLVATLALAACVFAPAASVGGEMDAAHLKVEELMRENERLMRENAGFMQRSQSDLDLKHENDKLKRENDKLKREMAAQAGNAGHQARTSALAITALVQEQGRSLGPYQQAGVTCNKNCKTCIKANPERWARHPHRSCTSCHEGGGTTFLAPVRTKKLAYGETIDVGVCVNATASKMSKKGVGCIWTMCRDSKTGLGVVPSSTDIICARVCMFGGLASLELQIEMQNPKSPSLPPVVVGKAFRSPWLIPGLPHEESGQMQQETNTQRRAL